MRAPSGPTLVGARRRLAPLFFARAARGSLTPTGAYAVPFAAATGPQGTSQVALHLADGSGVVAGRQQRRQLSVWIGPEPFGSCIARLDPPRLAGGWLPILRVGYRDGAGRQHREESFSTRAPGDPTLTTFLRVDGPAAVAASGRRLVVRGRTGYFAWSRPGSLRRVSAAAYQEARHRLVAGWQARLAAGGTFEVPEPEVFDAERALLVQNLALTWRYSVGNGYEEFSFPESVDNAMVMADYGQEAVARSILRTSLTRRPSPYPNWTTGEKLLGFARLWRLSGDVAGMRAATPVLRRYVAALGRQIDRSRTGLLAPERYSSDISDVVLGLHSQAVVWQGLRELAPVWAQTGKAALARRCQALAARLGAGLRAAVRRSARRLPDGTLFVPVSLLGGERPYGALTASRLGSYWNLVMPYALASGLFPPQSRDALGIWRYMQSHGSRLLGMVRASAFALYKTPRFPVSGTDQVYGLNVARFLADNDQPDQLVLSLYGQLAQGMTPGTFVAGEGATVAPLDGLRLRSMYLPPNTAANAAFLETLRLMLVHETRDRAGAPRALELAYATPRAWLRPGKQIAVHDAPTSFGPLSYTIAASKTAVHAEVDLPANPPRQLRLRFRLPRGSRIGVVILNGDRFTRVDRRSSTLDLSGLSGTLILDVDRTSQ
jgi:hypothetical protein